MTMRSPSLPPPHHHLIIITIIIISHIIIIITGARSLSDNTSPSIEKQTEHARQQHTILCSKSPDRLKAASKSS